MSSLQVCWGSLSDSKDDIFSGAQIRLVNNNAKAAIHSLPHEILASILHQTPFGEKRNELRRVCQLWKTVMDTSVGITIRIGTCSIFEEFDPMILEFGHTENIIPKYNCPSIISRVGIDRLFVGNISETWEDDHSWLTIFGFFYNLWNYLQPSKIPAALPKFKSPNLVTTLNICGRISCQHFNHFLEELKLLKAFTIGFFSLENFCSTQLENLLIPHLEFLVIRTGIRNIHPFHESMENWDLQKILNNILAILENRFPKLEYAAIDLVYDTHRGLEITKALLNFLQQHTSTMKFFNVEYSVLLNNEFRMSHAPEQHPDLLETVNSLKQQSLQLNGMSVLPVCVPKLPFSQAWTSIAAAQESLTDFAIVGVCQDLEFLQQMIQVNYKTLTAILLWEVKLFDVLTNTVKLLDCTCFSTCHNLTKLGLRGWTVTLTVSTVMHVDQLPKGLKEIDFRDMAISTENIRILALEMPNLEELELHFVGNKQGMGMDVTTLKNIIEQRKLTKVRIYRSLNGHLDDSDPEGIFNGDVSNSSQINEVLGLIAFDMGPTGYYVSAV